MDGAHFDHLTRSLARGTSRRGLLKGLAAGLLGGVSSLRATETDAQRAPRQANGESCARATDCGSFHCVNGFCCDTPCTGQCESCASGTCQPVAGAPESGRPSCPGSGPCAAACDGITTTSCAAYPGADTPCGAPTCANGLLTTPVCGGNGACVATTTDCAPYGCDPTGTACATGCQTDVECGPGSHCDNNTCLPDEDIGAPCDEDTDCRSGHCITNVCCVERCAACQVCNLPGNEGFCGSAPNGDECEGGRCCEGGCVDLQSDVEHCGGCDQSCLGVPNGTAVCDQGVCRESCTDDTHCIDGTHCDRGDCIPDEGLGDDCTTTTDCIGGVCVGGVCCLQECPAPTNGAATCSADGLHCGFTCDDDFHVCGERCIPTDTCCTAADCVPDPLQCQGTATACTDGACSFAPAQDDTSCGDNRVCCGGACCEVGQECTAGVCTVACPICQVYDAEAGACVADAAAEFDPCPGFACFTGGGLCIAGVCTPIGQPLEQGAICRPDACSQGTCFGAECRNVRPLTCHHLDTDCQVGVCDPVTGCHSVNRENGIDCPPTRPCAASSTCFNGACFSAGMANEDTPCDRDACNVNGVCRSGTCAFTEPFDCGPCRTCQDGACVPGNDGAACQENCFPGTCRGGDCFVVIFPDQRACPICQTCQNETCVADIAQEDQTCVSEGHICCDGACVSNTTTDHCGACATACDDPLDVCVDGACCRPAGRDCTNGSDCCGEPGIDGQCVNGICGGGGAFCLGDGVCASAACCDNRCCAVGTRCFIADDPFCGPCLSLGQTCDPDLDHCCQDGGETQCQDVFDSCCHSIGGSCSQGSDCCVKFLDPNTFLFVECTEGICGGMGASCLGATDCASGQCCLSRCCGEGEFCVDRQCVPVICKPLGAVCDPAIGDCCQDDEVTVCDTVPGVAGAVCRHPAGGSCESDNDCADSLNCSPNGVCGGTAPGTPCESASDCGGAVCCAVCCRLGDECGVGSEGGVCIPASCSEEGESCNPDPNFDDCCGNELVCGSDGFCREAIPDCDALGLVECDGECCVDCCVRAGIPHDVTACCGVQCTVIGDGTICLG